MSERARILDILGAHLALRSGCRRRTARPHPVDLVVTSPGWRPDQPLLAAAAAAGIPVWGEVELAWRMRPREGAAPWLTVTGTNGKTTTVQMLASILRAAGLRACSAGNVGTPVLEAVMDPEPYDVIAVELSSFQLHWSHSLAPAGLGLPQRRPRPRRLARLARRVRRGQGQGLRRHRGRLRLQRAGRAHPPPRRGGRGPGGLSRRRVHPRRPRAVGGSASSTTCSPTAPSSSSAAPPQPSSRRSTTCAATRPTPAPHLVANALAAAALARAHGVPAGRRAGRAARLRARAAPHRRGRRRSTASAGSTTPRPPTRTPPAPASPPTSTSCGSPAACSRAPTSTTSSPAPPTGCAAWSSSGATGRAIAEALARHAPDVPVVDVDRTDTGAMDLVVREARALAHDGRRRPARPRRGVHGHVRRLRRAR